MNWRVKLFLPAFIVIAGIIWYVVSFARGLNEYGKKHGWKSADIDWQDDRFDPNKGLDVNNSPMYSDLPGNLYYDGDD